MNISPSVLGGLRVLAVLVSIAVLKWASVATNISFIGNGYVVSLIVMIAGAIEHTLEAQNGKALFGVVAIK